MTNIYKGLTLPIYNTKGNHKVSSFKRLLAPLKQVTQFTKKNLYTNPSTYSYSPIKPTFAKTKTASDGLLKTYIFPTANNLNNIINNHQKTNHHRTNHHRTNHHRTNYHRTNNHRTKEYINKKTLSMSPSPHFPPFIVKSDKHKYKRCKHGYKRNNITKRCNKNK
jgi:hypothetical protein